MSRELWTALIGVGGTLLAALGAQWAQVLHARRGRRWAVEDSRTMWTRERESRLFDCKRTSYFEFLAVSKELAIPRTMQSSSDAQIHSLYDKFVAITLYGSPEVAATAEELFGSHAELAECDNADDRGEWSAAVWRDYEIFLAAARHDLGVDTPEDRKR